MKLYSLWRSSSAWRVRIALNLKGLAYDYVSVDLVGKAQFTDDFKKRNAMSQVPVLEWEEGGQVKRLSQSLAIIDYLEHVYPEPALYPKEPYARAKVLQLAELVNSGIQPFQNRETILDIERHGIKQDEWLHHWITRGMHALDREAAQTAGTYMFGDTVTVADCLLMPQMYAARRFKADIDSCATLLRVEKACDALEAFKKAHADHQPDTPKK